MPDATPATRVEALLLRVRNGERGALEELYKLHGSAVFGLASYLLNDRSTAEDAASEIFLRLPRVLHSFDGRIPFERWLTRITAHLCIDWLRRRRLEKRLFEPEGEGDAADDAGSPLDSLLMRERQEAVRNAIRNLPDRYRAPIVLRYYAGMSYDEIAERLQVSREQAGVLLFRGRRLLRRTLEGDDR